MNILLLTSHSIAEYDDVRMFTTMGVNVFSIGAYTNPHDPQGSFRPALPQATRYEWMEALCREQREKHGPDGEGWAIDWAKADLHPDILAWADTIICHHYLDRWIVPQWSRIKNKRVIWRTCGQSDPALENLMGRFRKDGLEIVRYSPREREAFERFGAFAGMDAMIRFGKYPSDYPEWTGGHPVVGNVTQDMRGRGEGGFDATGLRFWLEATKDLPAQPAGPKSESLPGGLGALTYPAMLAYLAMCRTYLYTGTVPASYTLGLIEAMMVGVPIVSIGPNAWAGPPPLFEGHSLSRVWADTPDDAHRMLTRVLEDDDYAAEVRAGQHRGVLFRMENVGPMWADFLGVPQVESIEVFK